MTISGKKTNAKHFAFDGCHKFYLLESEADFNECLKEWGGDDSIYPISKLPEEFYNSCPLRFIQTWSDFKSYVPQGRNSVTFRRNDGVKVIIDFKLDKVWETRK